jgi:hypothetical protein
MSASSRPARLDEFDARDPRRSILEATHNGKTRSRGVRAGLLDSGDRSRTDRVFRDIHGTDHPCNDRTVLFDRHGGDAAGDDDVLRRHWVVVCSDR